MWIYLKKAGTGQYRGSRHSESDHKYADNAPERKYNKKPEKPPPHKLFCLVFPLCFASLVDIAQNSIEKNNYGNARQKRNKRVNKINYDPHKPGKISLRRKHTYMQVLNSLPPSCTSVFAITCAKNHAPKKSAMPMRVYLRFLFASWSLPGLPLANTNFRPA